MSELTVLFDFKNPYSLLALEPTLELLDRLGVEASWQPMLVAPLTAAAEPDPGADRGAWHRWHRACYRVDDLRRYAAARGLPEGCFDAEKLFSGADGRAAAAAWLWCEGRCQSPALLRALFEGYWFGELEADSAAAVSAVLDEVAGQALGFEAGSAAALDALDAQQVALKEAGCFDVPGYLIDDEVYYGRQHLPMVAWHLAGRAGSPPVFHKAADA